MDEPTIITNRVPRDILDAYELTPRERETFDYLDWDAIEEGRESASFFRYKGQLYNLGEINGYENDGMGAHEDDAYISYERNGLHVSFAGKPLGTYPTLRRAQAAVSVQMRREGYFPNVWLTGEHGSSIRRIDVW